MKKITFLVTFILLALSLKSQWYKEEPKSTLFYSTAGFPGIGGDVGITDSLYVGFDTDWNYVIGPDGIIKTYGGAAPPLNYVLMGTGTTATFQPLPASGGSVVNVASGNFAPLFTVSIATPTTTPTFSFSSISQTGNMFYASPYSGPGLPNFRALRSEDFTGTIGTSGYVLSSDGAGGFSWIAMGGGGATYFTDLLDVPSSYSGKARKLVAVNAAETGLEFVAQIEESGANLRIGSSSAYGSIYNIVIGEGSKTGAASSRNTYIGYQINNAASSDGENTIIGPSTLPVNATTQTIVGTVVNHARISGMVAIGSYMTLPTTGIYPFPGTNSPILIGHNINHSDNVAASKGSILIGRNISTAGFLSNATTAAIIISQDPTLGDGMQNSIGIGQGVSLLDAEPNGIAIGDFSKIYLDPTYGNGGGQSIAIGLYTYAGSWRSLAIGSYAQALAVSSTAIGYGAYSNKPHADTWGRGGYNDVEGATLIYGTPSDIFDDMGVVYFGAIAAKHLNPAMPGGESLDMSARFNAGTAYTRLTTASGRDATAVPTLVDTRGATLELMGGASTGTAAGGDLAFGVTLAGGVSNNTENTWDEALRIKGADAHIYITQNPDDDNTNTKVLSRDPITQEVEETDLPTGITFQQIYGIIALKL